LTATHGRPQKFFQGGNTNILLTFQVAGNAMQMDVNKTLYPFYSQKITPHVHGRRKGLVGPSLPNFEI